MIELIVAVCMIDDASRCKKVRLNFEVESVTAEQCEMYGQIELAKWIGEHPNWVIKRWKCQPAGQYADL